MLSSRECGKEVRKRVQAGWSGCKRESGVICYRRAAARAKVKKNYKMAVRPALLLGWETAALTKRQEETELEVSVLKIFLWSEWMGLKTGKSEEQLWSDVLE